MVAPNNIIEIRWEKIAAKYGRALATALTTWLASRQLDETLVRYNQSATDLANVRDWWTRLSPAAKRNPKDIDQLVEVTEKVLETELSGWSSGWKTRSQS